MVSGREIKAERQRAGLTQAEVAARLGVSPQRVANAENMLSVAPTFVSRYLAALGRERLSPESLLEGAWQELIAQARR